MISRIFKQTGAWIDQQPMSIAGWLMGLICIILIRCLLEAFSSPSSSGIIASDAPTLVHYLLWYTAVVMGMSCILSIFTGHAARAPKLLLMGLPIIWLAPSLDLILSHGDGFHMAYFFGGAIVFVLEGLLFLTPWSGLTPGIRIELTLIFILAGLYAWASGQKALATAKTVLALYGFIFFMISLPCLVYLMMAFPAAFQDLTATGIFDFLHTSLERSALATNTLHGTLAFASNERAFEIGFDYLMGEINFLLVCIFSAAWLFLARPKMLTSILRNARPERVFFYLALLGCGMGEAYALGTVKSASWVDGLSGLVLGLAWFCGWMHAVHTNDLTDCSIDAISNPNRPLITGDLSADDIRQSGWVWGILSLLGTATVGYYPFYMNIIFLCCYHIYSAPPLRLKRVPLLSSFLIAMAVLVTILAGFFFLSGDKKLTSFPLSLAIGIVVVFTLGVNIRDLKDAEGDRAAGIYTLPVVCGRYGAPIVGLLFALAFLSVPLFLHANILYIMAVPAGAVGYAIAIHKPYKEKWVFPLFFVAITCTILLLIYRA